MTRVHRPDEFPVDIGDVERRLRGVEDPQLETWRVVGGVGQPAFGSPWVNYDAAHPARYWRDPWGVVHVEGWVKTGTTGTTIFTLPVGYRPAQDTMFASVGNNGFARVDVQSDGDVRFEIGAASSFLSLDCLSFRAEL